MDMNPIYELRSRLRAAAIAGTGLFLLRHTYHSLAACLLTWASMTLTLLAG